MVDGCLPAVLLTNPDCLAEPSLRRAEELAAHVRAWALEQELCVLAGQARKGSGLSSSGIARQARIRVLQGPWRSRGSAGKRQSLR